LPVKLLVDSGSSDAIYGFLEDIAYWLERAENNYEDVFGDRDLVAAFLGRGQKIGGISLGLVFNIRLPKVLAFRAFAVF